jgi:hypothetical protein
VEVEDEKKSDGYVDDVDDGLNGEGGAGSLPAEERA